MKQHLNLDLNPGYWRLGLAWEAVLNVINWLQTHFKRLFYLSLWEGKNVFHTPTLKSSLCHSFWIENDHNLFSSKSFCPIFFGNKCLYFKSVYIWEWEQLDVTIVTIALISYCEQLTRLHSSCRWQYCLGCTLARSAQITLKKFWGILFSSSDPAPVNNFFITNLWVFFYFFICIIFS